MAVASSDADLANCFCRVNLKKSVATIEAIEKYGSVTKKRANLIQHVKEKLHISHEDPEEEQKEQDKEDVEKIEKDEHEEPIDVNKEEKEGGGERLPGDGKRVEEMSEDEKMERGLALVARAWERGMEHKVKKGAEKDGKGQETGRAVEGQQANGGDRR